MYSINKCTCSSTCRSMNVMSILTALTKSFSLLYINYTPWCCSKWPIIYTKALRHSPQSHEIIIYPFKYCILYIMLMHAKYIFSTSNQYKLTAIVITDFSNVLLLRQMTQILSFASKSLDAINLGNILDKR